jgi:hypothetical protein
MLASGPCLTTSCRCHTSAPPRPQAQLPPWALAWHLYLSSLKTGDTLNYAYLEAIIGTIQAPFAPPAIAAAAAAALPGSPGKLAPLRLRPLLAAPGRSDGEPAAAQDAAAVALSPVSPTPIPAAAASAAGPTSPPARRSGAPAAQAPAAAGAASPAGSGRARGRVKRLREGPAAGAAPASPAAAGALKGGGARTVKRAKGAGAPTREQLRCEE